MGFETIDLVGLQGIVSIEEKGPFRTDVSRGILREASDACRRRFLAPRLTC
jgi:hypothetical protein